MTKYVIGTISDMDTPLTPRSKGLRSMTAWLAHITREEVQRERDEVLSATEEDIHEAGSLYGSDPENRKHLRPGRRRADEERKRAVRGAQAPDRR